MRQRLAGFERCKNSVFNNVGEIGLSQMAQHHRRGEDQRRWIDHVLTGVFWRRTVHRLKDRHTVAVVRARCKTEAAYEARCEIADDVAVQVRSDNYIKLRWIFHHLVCNVIDDQVIRLKRRILLAKIFADLLEEPFGKLQNVCLARSSDLVTTFAQGQLVGETNDLLGTCAADQLDRLCYVVRLQMFNTGVEVFNVLAHDDHVDSFALVARRHAGEFARWSHVGIRLKEFA